MQKLEAINADHKVMHVSYTSFDRSQELTWKSEKMTLRILSFLRRCMLLPSLRRCMHCQPLPLQVLHVYFYSTWYFYQIALKKINPTNLVASILVFFNNSCSSFIPLLVLAVICINYLSFLVCVWQPDFCLQYIACCALVIPSNPIASILYLVIFKNCCFIPFLAVFRFHLVSCFPSNIMGLRF